MGVRESCRVPSTLRTNSANRGPEAIGPNEESAFKPGSTVSGSRYEVLSEIPLPISTRGPWPRQQRTLREPPEQIFRLHKRPTPELNMAEQCVKDSISPAGKALARGPAPSFQRSFNFTLPIGSESYPAMPRHRKRDNPSGIEHKV
jgi:hypothetical protein